MFISKLPKWCLVSKFPAFYDFESLTATEQTARLYGKVAELIESYNKYVEEINKVIEEYGTEKDENINNLIHRLSCLADNYINTVDMKIMHQNRQIAEVYTKFSEDIINSIKITISDLKETGELDNAILSALDNINEKVDNFAKECEVFKAEMTEDYANTKAQLEQDYSAKKTALEGDYNSTKEQLAQDYSNTKSQLEQDYSTTKTALEGDYNTTKEQLETDFTESKTAFDNMANNFCETGTLLISREGAVHLNTCRYVKYADNRYEIYGVVSMDPNTTKQGVYGGVPYTIEDFNVGIIECINITRRDIYDSQEEYEPLNLFADNTSLEGDFMLQANTYNMSVVKNGYLNVNIHILGYYDPTDIDNGDE